MHIMCIHGIPLPLFLFLYNSISGSKRNSVFKQHPLSLSSPFTITNQAAKARLAALQSTPAATTAAPIATPVRNSSAMKNKDGDKAS